MLPILPTYRACATAIITRLCCLFREFQLPYSLVLWDYHLSFLLASVWYSYQDLTWTCKRSVFLTQVKTCTSSRAEPGLHLFLGSECAHLSPVTTLLLRSPSAHAVKPTGAGSKSSRRFRHKRRGRFARAGVAHDLPKNSLLRPAVRGVHADFQLFRKCAVCAKDSAASIPGVAGSFSSLRYQPSARVYFAIVDLWPVETVPQRSVAAVKRS